MSVCVCVYVCVRVCMCVYARLCVPVVGAHLLWLSGSIWACRVSCHLPFKGPWHACKFRLQQGLSLASFDLLSIALLRRRCEKSWHHCHWAEHIPVYGQTGTVHPVKVVLQPISNITGANCLIPGVHLGLFRGEFRDGVSGRNDPGSSKYDYHGYPRSVLF